jgi:hypothetical protein
MTFFPLSVKALAITFVIAALAGGAITMTRPKVDQEGCAGLRMAVHPAAFVITTCALRPKRQASPALETTSKVAVR